MIMVVTDDRLKPEDKAETTVSAHDLPQSEGESEFLEDDFKWQKRC